MRGLLPRLTRLLENEHSHRHQLHERDIIRVGQHPKEPRQRLAWRFRLDWGGEVFMEMCHVVHISFISHPHGGARSGLRAAQCSIDSLLDLLERKTELLVLPIESTLVRLGGTCDRFRRCGPA